MKRFIITLIALCSLIHVQAQANKTLVKSIALDGAMAVAFNLPGAIEVTEWDEDIVRVTTEVTTENFSEVFIKRLTSVGRYTLDTQVEEGVLVVRMPQVEKRVTIKGTQLVERFKYQVRVPTGMQVKITDTTNTEL